MGIRPNEGTDLDLDLAVGRDGDLLGGGNEARSHDFDIDDAAGNRIEEMDSDRR